MSAPETPAPKAKKPFNYVTIVGIIFILIVLVALVNLLRTEDSGTVGIGQVGVGEKIEPFAVPVAASALEGDANIDPDRACEVEGEDVIRICDYFDRPLVMSFWFTRGSSRCIEQQDVFERAVAPFRGRVGALSINVRDDRDRVRQLISEHGWRVPVGHDEDGAVSNIYRVGVCPTYLFVKPGGVLKNAVVGDTSASEIEAQIRSLIDVSKQEKPQAG